MAQNKNLHGFTLVEMSIVLIVIGLVIMLIFPAMKTLRANQQRNTTQSNLENLMNATAAYIQAHGCLPCPTPPDSSNKTFGRVRGDAIDNACGTCVHPEGIAPFASLTIPESAAKDGYDNWITMRVDPALTINFGSAPPSSKCMPSDPLPCISGERRKGFCQEDLSKDYRIIVSSPSTAQIEAAVIFVSHGQNGLGAFRSLSMTSNKLQRYLNFTRTCSAFGGYEHCNADGDRNFAKGIETNDGLLPFDDQLMFLGRNALVTYLGNAACQTAW